MSCVAYEGVNGYVAMVADVTVDRASGAITVTHLTGAQDCGPISNPDDVRNQIALVAHHDEERMPPAAMPADVAIDTTIADGAGS